MTGYFVDRTTVAEARERYRSLAKQHHPDAGGDTATLQAINAEWELISHQLSSPRLTHPPELVREQHGRMWAAMLESARRLCPGAHVYARGNCYYHHVCIAVPADHPTRAELITAGYRRHSAWRCWRKERMRFEEYDTLISWLRGECSAPFAEPEVIE